MAQPPRGLPFSISAPPSVSSQRSLEFLKKTCAPVQKFLQEQQELRDAIEDYRCRDGSADEFWRTFEKKFGVKARDQMKTFDAWGTLHNGRLEARDSTRGGDYGRGLFAAKGGAGFREGEAITLYSGKLLTRKQMEARTDEKGGHMYMMRISGSGRDMFIDGKDFADGVTETQRDKEGHILYVPKQDDLKRWHQGPGSLANDSRGQKDANARLDFVQLDKEGVRCCVTLTRLAQDCWSRSCTLLAAQLVPKVPIFFAKRDIEPGEEILFDCVWRTI